jgi:polyisoprenoid-binding protein YceI
VETITVNRPSRTRRRVGALALALVGGWPWLVAAGSGARNYRIDAARSTLVVMVFKAGMGSGLAHDHVVRASEFSGKLRIDPASPAESSIAVTVRAASLVPDEPTVREKFKVAKQLSESDRKKVKKTMDGEEQLSVVKFPEITFVSKRIDAEGMGKVKVSGVLTLHGVSREVSFPAAVSVADGTFHGRGTLEFKQSEFGIKPYSALFGTIRNQDTVRLNFDLVAVAE